MIFNCQYCGTCYQLLHNCPNCGAPARIPRIRIEPKSPYRAPANLHEANDFFSIEAERIKGSVDRAIRIKSSGPFLILPEGMGITQERVIHERSS